MAAKKKEATSSALADNVPPSNAAAAIQSNGTNSDNVTVDAVTYGQLKVNLHDFGIPAEDHRSYAKDRCSPRRGAEDIAVGL